MHINYPVMSLLKVKITPKIKSKLCNHKKVLNCTNIKFYIIIYIKYYPRYVSSPCIHGRDKNTNSQLNGSIKYVSNILLSSETHRRATTGNTKSREVARALEALLPRRRPAISVTRPEVLWKTGCAT